MIVISYKNNSNKAKDFNFYKQLILFEKNLIKKVLPIIM